MKNAFEYLNDVKMDLEGYEEEIMTEREIEAMKNKLKVRKFSIKKTAVIAACAAVVLALGATVVSGMAGKYIKMLTTGHNIFYQVDPNTEVWDLPEEMLGMIFDENGNEVTVLRGSVTEYYDKDGNVLDQEGYAKIIEEAFGGEVVLSTDNDPSSHEYTFQSLEEAREIANFDIKVPAYLPEGWELHRVYTYTGDTKEPSGDYMTLTYKNGDKEMNIFERIINEETAFESGSNEEIEAITVAGRTAVIEGGRSINLETADDVSVGIYGKGYISREDLIKMMESAVK